jgi:trehalose 6-phosphate phosphatase
MTPTTFGRSALTFQSVVVSAENLKSSTSETSAPDLLSPLRARPDRSAVLCDVDGTIAPIVARPEEASAPPRARELLAELGRRYALVGCVSGRRATDARRVVGVDSIAYIGNHGLEYLAPGAESAETVPELRSHDEATATFARDHYTSALREAGVRLEDKRSIWSFHWREATDERSARNALEEVAKAALERGLEPHWGRKVLEIRPALGVDKGTAIASVLGEAEVKAALYAGDDTTDLDAFRALRSLRSDRALDHAVCVGVRSEEGPAEISSEADLVVEGPDGVLELLAVLAS